MNEAKKYFPLMFACILGIIIGLSYSSLVKNAQAAKSNVYKQVCSNDEVISSGQQGWEYLGLGPGGSCGIMKKN